MKIFTVFLKYFSANFLNTLHISLKYPKETALIQVNIFVASHEPKDQRDGWILPNISGIFITNRKSIFMMMNSYLPKSRMATELLPSFKK